MPLVSSMLSQPESSHPGDPGNSTPPQYQKEDIVSDITLFWWLQLVQFSQKTETKYHNGKG